MSASTVSARRFASRQRQIAEITAALAAEPGLGTAKPAPRGHKGSLREWADRVLADPEAAVRRADINLGCGHRVSTIDSVRMDVVREFYWTF